MVAEICFPKMAPSDIEDPNIHFQATKSAPTGTHDSECVCVIGLPACHLLTAECSLN